MKRFFRFYLFVSIVSLCSGLLSNCLAQGNASKKDTCYSGDCKNGSGVMHYTNGNDYTGQFINSLPEGNGTMRYASGARYEGQFVKGIKQGKGTYYYKSGNRYTGQYINNRIEGDGTFYFGNGDRYEGHFINGDFEGTGTFYYASGNKYIGSWSKNKKNGSGVLTFPNGSKYNGNFRDDQFNGIGTYYFRDGSRYAGSFVNGDKHGNGVYVFRDSSRYEGEFVGDAIQGKGISHFANGDRYDGEFLNGMSEGKGTYYYKQGDKFEGTFKSNLMDGVGTYTAVDGSYNTVTYRKGVIVPESAKPNNPQQINDTLNIEKAPPSVSVDTMQSKLTPLKHDSNTVVITEISKAHLDTTLAHKTVLTDTTIVRIDTAPKTFETAKPDTTMLALNVPKVDSTEIKKKSDSVVPVVTEASIKPEPVVLKCGACNGSGKKYQSEISRKRVVTKDISNGVGPKNYVTYTVDDVVRPAGYAICSVCHGTGRKS